MATKKTEEARKRHNESSRRWKEQHAEEIAKKHSEECRRWRAKKAAKEGRLFIPRGPKDSWQNIIPDFAKIIAELYNTFEFAGNYTGPGGTVDIRCTECGATYTRDWHYVRTGKAVCKECKRLKDEQERLRIEAEAEAVKADQELQRRINVVATRCPGFEYVGNYTGSGGTVDIKCKTCGSIITKSWITIRHAKGKDLKCETCKTIELNRMAKKKAEDRERARKSAEEQKESRRIVKFFSSNATQMEMHVCPGCGGMFAGSTKYCSEECCKRVNNRRHKDKRFKRMQTNIVDRDITPLRAYDRYNGVCWICGGLCDKTDYKIVKGRMQCGDLYPSVDHIVEISQGGEHSWKNVKLAHRSCNRDRHWNPLVTEQFAQA